ncbi:hypothetical protein N836_00675 [Leptolyngbya sp. Heron Island J]|uniref:PEP-CTERM sorting domain-containing protein n=1 Tax=Leptolyngbya sp. Heron Island J TaxID=1385935 RepID=UPI0003B947CD|nr:PEP-CTERM sorting domain-containing protein [Leptolyngbya sp. Heron Island J]ESA36421.1 hypothetical protein N836_00675 [Leptolyngbya sp. Heron Island J]
MNKLLISAGATLSAAGLLVAAPAAASTLSFDFQLNSSTEVELSSFLAGRTFSNATVPNSLNATANDVTGSFIVLDDLTQVSDGDIELDDDFIDNLLDGSYMATVESILVEELGLTLDQTLESVDDLFTITEFSGGGVLTSEAIEVVGNPNNPSQFDITYDSETNTITVDGYSNKVATSCFWADCGITADVTYGFGLVIDEFISFTDDLLANPNIALGDETTEIIIGLQRSAAFIQWLAPSLEAITLATVTSTIAANTQFVAADPNGSIDDVSAEVTGGTLTVLATTDGQEEELFVAQYGEEIDTHTTEGLVTVAQLETVKSTPPQASLSVTSKTPVTIAQAFKSSDKEAEAVPEPSIVVGFLGLAVWMAKRSRKQGMVR